MATRPLARLGAKLFARSSRGTRHRTAQLRIESLEDRWVPAQVVFEDTYSLTGPQGGATVEVTVTADAPGHDGQYLWNYHLTNDSFVSESWPGMGVFFVAADPGLVADMGSNVGWNTNALDTPEPLVYWNTGESGPWLGIGDAADFWFTTAPVGIGTASLLCASDTWLTGASETLGAAPVSLPVVSVVSLNDVVEGGAEGAFRFTRAGDTNVAVTVNFEIDNRDDDIIATSGTDYQSLITGGGVGSVTFAVGQTVLDLVVMPYADNEFEEDEQVVLTLLPSGSTPAGYVVTGSGEATVTITDDAPVVSFTAEWFSTGETVGYITLTRTGGDINAPLTAWFVPEGTAELDGETVRVSMAATAVFPAEVTSLVVTLTSEAVAGGLFAVQMDNAQPQGQRADLSAQLEAMLNGTPGAGTAFANFIRDTRTLPNPLTWQEWIVLREAFSLEDGAWGSAADARDARAALKEVLDRTGIDWRTLPNALSPHLHATAAASGFAVALVATGAARTEARAQQLILDLGSPDFATRDSADRELRNWVMALARRGDFGNFLLVYDRVRAAILTSENAELVSRARTVLTYMNGQAVLDFRESMLRAAAATAGWLPFPTP
ncbi:hypothetical protein J0H58_10010 [bacterium]|nr:hypothetical protein [bacterium]